MRASPPGPRGHLLLGSLPEFARDVLGFQQRCQQQYGDIVRFRVANRRIFSLYHPDLVHSVLVTNHRDFIKHSFFWRHVTAIFGAGLLTSEGDSWLHQRRLMAPAFHRERIASYGSTMVELAEAMTEDWRDGEVRNVHHEMMALTLKIVAKVLFDADVAADVDIVGRSFDAVTDEIAVRFRRPVFVPDWVPLPGNLRYRAGVAKLNEVVYRIIAQHRVAGAQGNDLLSMLMRARDDAGNGMSDQQLRDEAVTLLLAGHETTALALSWAWYLLSRHPRAAAALAHELDSVLAGRAPTVADMPALRYTESVILESMRLFPPAYGIGREALKDCEIGGYHVPARSTIFISPWVIHHDARWYDEPNDFRPERWADGLADRLPRHAYMPFGGGPRICIGNSFALMEAVLLLAVVAQRFKCEPSSEEPAIPFPTITLRPRGGVVVRLRAR